MKSSPQATFLMTAYNASATIAEAIESVLAQTAKDFILLIVDDASTDNTAEIIHGFKDGRIHYIHNEKNLHIAHAANRGLGLIETDFILRLDADDIAVPTRLATQLTFMNTHPKVGVCGSYTEYFGSRETIWKMPLENDNIKANLIWDNCFANSSTIIRREVLVENNLAYTDTFKHPPFEDYELWIKLIPLTDFANIPEVRCRKRESPISQTQLHANTLQTQFFNFYKWVFVYFNLPITEDEIRTHILAKSGRKIANYTELMAFKEWQQKLYSHFSSLSFMEVESLHQTNKKKWLSLLDLIPNTNFNLLISYFKLSDENRVSVLKRLVKKCLGF
ncbi:MAG: glycosyltransferase family 2 protein [Bacteroidetes bacterium]|nr:glycosyltransferase family 2 protein [Bacteroidota bacterium]